MNPDGLSRLRQGVYRLLGAGTSHPTRELVAVAEATPLLLDELGLFDFSYAADLVDACGLIAQSDFELLAIEYVTLFEAGVTGIAYPAFESAYRADARTGQTAELVAEVRRTVLRYGLTLDEAKRDMIDHIGTELEIMAMLCRRESQRRREGKPTIKALMQQDEFLREHLLSWAPGYAMSVGRVEGHPVYSAIAKALAAFLEDERQLVPLLLAGERSD